MSRPGAHHDGELEPGLHRGIFSSSSTGARHHGHKHTRIPQVYWPKFSLEQVRFNTSLRPSPEVYPLVAAVAVALGCAGVITWHDMRLNPEVLVRKDTRQLQVCTKEDEPSAFERLVNQSEKAYDHGLRRYVLGSKPWVFPWLEERAPGISRRAPTIDLDKEKWRVNKEKRRSKEVE